MLLDMGTFYPWIPLCSNISRLLRHPVPVNMLHPALHRPILNNPDYGSEDFYVSENGRAAVLVNLGDPDPSLSAPGNDLSMWWPACMALGTREHLWNRILNERHCVPAHLAAALALIPGLYALPGRTYQRPFQLSIFSSVIVDFGLAFGSVDIPDTECLAYRFPDGHVELGQDPENHSWLYFRAANGEEATLDLACNNFSCACFYVTTEGYLPKDFPHPKDAAVFWRDRSMRSVEVPPSSFYTERRRLSLLRNSPLTAVAFKLVDAQPSQLDIALFAEFVRDLTGSTSREFIQNTAKEAAELAIHSIGMSFAHVICAGVWRTWPVQPASEADPAYLHSYQQQPATAGRAECGCLVEDLRNGDYTNCTIKDIRMRAKLRQRGVYD